MNKVITIRGTSVSFDSIVCIGRYEYENLENIGNKGSIWFPLCLFKQEVWEGKPVVDGWCGGRYISHGFRKMMTLYLSNEKEINCDLDETIIADWKAYKENKQP